jgi:uncharacterized protein (DUF2384 family)
LAEISTARHWVKTPQEIFGGRSPQQLVDSGDAGDQWRVLTALIRIEYGVLS